MDPGLLFIGAWCAIMTAGLLAVLYRRERRPAAGPPLPDCPACVAAGYHSPPLPAYRYCRYGHCMDHCRKWDPACKCPLPENPTPPAAAKDWS